MEAPTAANETARLAALHDYAILDTPPEPEFDALTRLASHICGTPMALLTLVDRERQWFKSHLGLDTAETRREASFCAHAIEQPGLFVVTDALEDPRFADNPLVVSLPHIRFYAGAPLVTPEGHALGTLCVVDRVPRRLSDEQMEALNTLAGQAMGQLELRRQVRRLQEAVEAQERTDAERMDRAERTARHNAALVGLARMDKSDLQAELHAATRTAAETLDVERASVWLVPPGGEGGELECAALYRATTGEFESGGRLLAAQYPAYFAALAGSRAVAAGDAAADPRTRELAPYLKAQGIGAMLDVPLWRGGVVAGVLCCEHVGPPRPWAPDEEEFAANVADIVTLALEAADRRRAEEAARHAQGRGAAVIRAALDCVVVMDGEGRVLDFNPAAERTFGYAAGEVLGRPLAELIIPERFRGERGEGVEHHLSGGPQRLLGDRVETVAVRADGSEFPVELTVTRVPLDGPPVFTGHLRDITERVEAAEALERSLSILRATLESAADGLLVIDQAGNVVTANGKFASMWGVDPAALAPGSPAPLPQCAERVVDSEAFKDHILEIRHSPVGESLDDVWLKDGRVLELYSQPQLIGGETVGRVWSYRDVTARRTAEDEARRTADRMRAVASAAAAVVGADSPSELRRVLEEACRTVLSMDAFFIFAYDPRAHSFEGFGGNDAGEYTPPDVTPAAGTPGERVVKERRSLLTLHADDPAGRGASPTGSGRRSESVIRTPILVGGEVRGIISVQSYTAELYSAADVEVVEALASLAASALENLRLTAEQREAEAALRRSETRFRALFEQFPYSIQIFSPQGETLQVNRAWERLFLSRPAERRRFNPLTDPQLAEIHPLIRRGFAGDEVELPATLFDPSRVGLGPGRAEAPGAEGEGPRWLQASICPVKDEGGDIREVILVHQDVTDERRALDELRESEERSRTLIQTAADPIITMDEELAILSANPATEATFGYAAEELVGRSISILQPPEEEARGLASYMEAGTRTQEWATTELPALRRDGTVIPVEISIGEYMRGGRRIFAGFLRDITERKAAEQALREARDELELRVTERTAELAEANMALEEEVAERARAEDEVVQKSAELQAVFHALPDLYFRLESDGTILDFQAGLQMGLYATPDAFLGRRVQEVLPPHAGERVEAALARVAGDGLLTTVEYVLEGADGQPQEFEARLLPLDGGGQVVAVVRDITERKGWEREQRRREEHFRALIENGSDLIAIIGADGVTRYLSPSAERLLGWKTEERVGRSTMETIHPEDFGEVARLRDFAINNPGATIQVEFRYRHGDGSWRVFEAAARTLRPDSASEGLVVNARDVTERKRAEEALRRSEEHFRAVIENASDLVTILETDGIMRYQSPAVERLFGFLPAELEGRSAFELIHPDDVAGVVAALTEVTATPGETRSAAFRWRHKDGSWRHVEAVGTTLSRTAAEEGVIVNSRDVTERKRAEEALEQARAEAERAREAAEAANQAKSEFLSRMSHELRTPMNSILGFAQLLERRSPTPEQQRSVDQILRAGRHLLNLINEVLDIARIESDRQTLSLEPVRVDAALIEAVNLIRPLAAQNACMVSDPHPAPGRWVRADRQRLAQVLLNLLSNGVKYNRPGGSVRVTWEERDGSIRIGVHDTGRGIAPERMEELFVPFARLGAEETGVEGTGLGLALSHRLAEAMGGSLSAESHPGRGSTFWLELPVADDPSSRLPQPAPAAPEPRAETGTGPAATLLYVEDNLANLTLVESLLSSRPEITLLSAMQGRMGLDLAWEHAPDLILLDLHLPDMPGGEVLRRLRADRRTRDTPVVVISADATPGQVERLKAAGAHEYMTKPLDLDRFMEAVDRTLAERGEKP